MAGEARIPVCADTDIVVARQHGRRLAIQLGFTSGNATLIATAISELARNILLYAGTGEVLIRPVERDGRRGVTVVASDRGPGIPDLQRALLDGYSTSKRLGLGLPGVRRLMDEFSIRTGNDSGTSVEVTKWNR